MRRKWKINEMFICIISSQPYVAFMPSILWIEREREKNIFMLFLSFATGFYVEFFENYYYCLFVCCFDIKTEKLEGDTHTWIGVQHIFTIHILSRRQIFIFYVTLLCALQWKLQTYIAIACRSAFCWCSLSWMMMSNKFHRDESKKNKNFVHWQYLTATLVSVIFILTGCTLYYYASHLVADTESSNSGGVLHGNESGLYALSTLINFDKFRVFFHYSGTEIQREEISCTHTHKFIRDWGLSMKVIRGCF